MPQYTYPGVYIEELSSGVRTISPVATSITAFVGWAPQGPDDRAVAINTFTDYERTFGPIHPLSYLGYAVKHYFDNGGGQAYVLRLSNPAGAKRGEATAGGLKLQASSVGAWSRFYGVTIQLRAQSTRFSLRVVKFPANAQGEPNTSVDGDLQEEFTNLSVDPNDPRYVLDIVNDPLRGSRIAEVVKQNLTAVSHTTSPAAFSGGAETPPAALEAINDPVFTLLLDKVTTADGILDKVDLVNLLCVPGLTDVKALSKLLTFCKRRRALLIADCAKDATVAKLPDPGISGSPADYGAFYFPWINAGDPLAENRITDFPPCGFVAGIYARTDAARGVWKAPAGIDAALNGIHGPKETLTDKENGQLNINAVNCIRTFPNYGLLVWGARTLDGADERGSEWKYVPVRRTALFIEESLYRGTKWAVFEPNDEPLWSQLRLNIGAFMNGLFRQGAFQGRTPREAYFVKCDKETTTQYDINRGIVNVIVGFAPLKPAEFVVLKITQIAGQIDV